MSRSKRDILDTEAMLARLKALLAQHHAESVPTGSMVRTDAESLRRISMTLHRWHEMECGNSDSWTSWSIVRGRWVKASPQHSTRHFVHDDDGKPFMEVHRHRQTGSQPVPTAYNSIPDREAGALKRLKAIMARYPGLSYYVQGDPRGCALYILKPGDVPAGEDASSYYSRGLAVFQ